MHFSAGNQSGSEPLAQYRLSRAAALMPALGVLAVLGLATLASAFLGMAMLARLFATGALLCGGVLAVAGLVRQRSTTITLFPDVLRVGNTLLGSETAIPLPVTGSSRLVRGLGDIIAGTFTLIVLSPDRAPVILSGLRQGGAARRALEAARSRSAAGADVLEGEFPVESDVKEMEQGKRLRA